MVIKTQGRKKNNGIEVKKTVLLTVKKPFQFIIRVVFGFNSEFLL